MIPQAIRIGPLSLPTYLVIFIAAYIAGSFVLRRIRGKGDPSAAWAERHISNALLFGFIAWKLSPLIFSFSTVREAPAALLYMPGGPEGVLIGLLLGGGYLARHFLKAGKDRSLFLKTSGLLVLLMGAAAGLAFVFLLLIPRTAPQDNTVNQAAPVIEAGFTAPDFELSDGNGTTYKLSDYKGKAVVLNFWASWCPPCLAELPELKDFYREIDPQKAVFLAVNLTLSEKKPSELPGFIERHELTFPILFDDQGIAAGLYGINSIPTTVIIDPQGIIKAIRTGVVTRSWLDRQISAP